MIERGGLPHLVKPFAFAELLARVHALARRPPLGPVETVLRVADLEMDLLERFGGELIRAMPGCVR